MGVGDDATLRLDARVHGAIHVALQLLAVQTVALALQLGRVVSGE